MRLKGQSRFLDRVARNQKTVQKLLRMRIYLFTDAQCAGMRIYENRQIEVS